MKKSKSQWVFSAHRLRVECDKCYQSILYDSDGKMVLSPFCPWCGKPMEINIFNLEKENG